MIGRFEESHPGLHAFLIEWAAYLDSVKQTKDADTLRDAAGLAWGSPATEFVYESRDALKAVLRRQESRAATEWESVAREFLKWL